GLGGLRVGYGYGPTELIRILQRVRQPFNVNSVAQAAATAALSDNEFVQFCRKENEAGRRTLCLGLRALGLEVYGGSANFVLCRVGDGIGIFEELQKLGLIVRPLASYNMPEFVRITIGTKSENERMLKALADLSPSKRLVGTS
ncbi:MAG: aminotransferase class I/II-fold pyridoxal phosphate-dependent enzyme, partial [Verrucomicrobiota bacterium]